MALRVVMVGRDAAPSRCFQKLVSALTERSIESALFVGDGKPLKESPDDIRAAIVGGASLVLVGMSSSKELAEPEIVAATAASGAGIPYGFYLDIPRCANREWFGDLRDGAAFFFAPNEGDAENVRKSHPKAQVTVTGNPLREESFFLPFSRAEVRLRLGIAEDEQLILVSLGKSPMANAGVCERLYDELAQFSEGKKKLLRVFLSFHPGDRTPSAVDPAVIRNGVNNAIQWLKDMLNDDRVTSALIEVAEKDLDRDIGASFDDPKANLRVYADLAKFAPRGIRVEILKTEKGVFETDHAVPGADLVVGYGSSTEMTAGAQRVPCITLGGVVAKERNWSVTQSDTTEAIEAGASSEVEGKVDFSILIANLLYDSDMQEDSRNRQERALPAPTERGAAIVKMAAALEEIVTGSRNPSEQAESCS